MTNHIDLNCGNCGKKVGEVLGCVSLSGIISCPFCNTEWQSIEVRPPKGAQLPSVVAIIRDQPGAWVKPAEQPDKLGGTKESSGPTPIYPSETKGRLDLHKPTHKKRTKLEP